MIQEFILKLGLDGKGVAIGSQNVLSQLTALQGNAVRIFEKAMGFGMANKWLMGAAVVGGMVKSSIEASKEIKTLADSFEISTGEAQQFMQMAEQFGANAQDLAGNIGKIRKAQSEAVAGNKEAIKAFEDLGISAEEAGRLGAVELFYRISDAARSGKINVATYGALLKVLGKNAQEILPLLRKDLRGAAEDAKAFEIPESTVIRAEQMARYWREAGLAIRDATSWLSGAFMTAMQYAAHHLTVLLLKYVSLFDKSAADIRAELETQYLLDIDPDNQASLANIKRLEAMLAAKQAAKEAAKEAESQRKTSSARPAPVVPTDEHARLGLFTGYTVAGRASPVQIMRDQTLELKNLNKTSAQQEQALQAVIRRLDSLVHLNSDV